MKLLNTTQAARIIGVKRSMVIHYLQSGRLRGQRIGREWVIEEQVARSFKRRPVGKPKQA